MTKKIRESHNTFQPAFPGKASGNLEPIGRRDPNNIPPKFAFLLKDIDEDGRMSLRVLLTYSNGESIIVPSAGEPGCSTGHELVSKVIECFGENPETMKVVMDAVSRELDPDKNEDGTINESSITDRYQQMVNAMNVLHRQPGHKPNSPANMTKLEAIRLLRSMNIPDEKATSALVNSGHTLEEIEELLALADIEGL